MTDAYQAIYDATRSRIYPVNGSAIVSAVERAFDISYQKQHLQQAIYMVANEQIRPSVVFRPTLTADGDKWCALLGSDLAVGVAGFGDTPAEAMTNFDIAFLKERTPDARRLAATPKEEPMS